LVKLRGKLGYGNSARHYLTRARLRLRESKPESLFYAALELRCGIETRMEEYLGVWEHISESKKRGWRVAELARNVEETFRSGNDVVRCSLLDRASRRPMIIFYHTPVSPDAQKAAMRLGSYLHSLKSHKDLGDAFWQKLRTELDVAARLLETANIGTLLGPPMTKDDRKTNMKVELVFSALPADTVIIQMTSDAPVTMKLEYLSALPDKLEPEALAWDRRDLEG
jgi:hypothetical protein